MVDVTLAAQRLWNSALRVFILVRCAAREFWLRVVPTQILFTP